MAKDKRKNMYKRDDGRKGLKTSWTEREDPDVLADKREAMNMFTNEDVAQAPKPEPK